MTAATARNRPHLATVLDEFPTPPCAQLLGWQVLDANAAQGWIRIGFEARREFTNPAGFVQGGFLAAMLDDTMGPAVFVHTDGALYTATVDFNVSFMAPAKVGPIVGEGRVIKLGKTTGFVEAYLCDPDGEILAKATATVRLVPTDKALGSARPCNDTAVGAEDQRFWERQAAS